MAASRKSELIGIVRLWSRIFEEVPIDSILGIASGKVVGLDIWFLVLQSSLTYEAPLTAHDGLPQTFWGKGSEDMRWPANPLG